MTNDFTGFSFDNIHSSLLNIVRVSDGNRYTESFQSDFDDKRTQILGRDGEYYFGSDYQAREIKVKIAFDSMTEKQFRTMAYLFSTKKLCPLIFDERPYKKYMAKINSPIEIDYICFDQPKKIVVGTEPGDERYGVRRDPVTRELERVYPYETTNEIERIYKGEATIEFVCPDPYAHAPFKQLDLYRNTSQEGNVFTTYDTVDQWAGASGILSAEQFDNMHIDVPLWKENEIQFRTYNPGDKDSPFYLYIPFTIYTDEGGVGRARIGKNSGTTEDIDIDADDQFQLTVNNQVLLMRTIRRKLTGNNGLRDTGVIINSENHLIEGVVFDHINQSWKTTGNIYNDCILKGDFPLILHNSIHNLITNVETTSALSVTCYVPQGSISKVRLFYDYLYY